MLGKVPEGLFTTGLDDVVSQWLKTTQPADLNSVRASVAAEMLRVAEALIVSPKVTFKVYGENAVLSVLVKVFGRRAVHELLEAGVIDFVLWRPQVFYTDEENLLAQGVCPIQSGVLNSPPHSDPLVSAQTGLEGWCEEVTGAERDALSKLAASKTILPPEDVSHKAVARIVEAYGTGMLNAYGLESSIPISRVNAEQRRQLARLGESAVEASILLDLDLDVFERADTWRTLLAIIQTLKARGVVRDALEEILKLERLPSIPALILAKQISLSDVLVIRKRKETEDFREWLWSQPDPKDASRLSEEYLRQVTPKAKLQEKGWFKAARISTVSVVGGVIGTLAGGPIGGVGGAAIGTGIGTVVSLADGILAERVLRKPNPRRFATDVLGPMLMKSVVSP